MLSIPWLCMELANREFHQVNSRMEAESSCSFKQSWFWILWKNLQSLLAQNWFWQYTVISLCPSGSVEPSVNRNTFGQKCWKLEEANQFIYVLPRCFGRTLGWLNQLQSIFPKSGKKSMSLRLTEGPSIKVPVPWLEFILASNQTKQSLTQSRIAVRRSN